MATKGKKVWVAIGNQTRVHALASHEQSTMCGIHFGEHTTIQITKIMQIDCRICTELWEAWRAFPAVTFMHRTRRGMQKSPLPLQGTEDENDD